MEHFVICISKKCTNVQLRMYAEHHKYLPDMQETWPQQESCQWTQWKVAPNQLFKIWSKYKQDGNFLKVKHTGQEIYQKARTENQHISPITGLGWCRLKDGLVILDDTASCLICIKDTSNFSSGKKYQLNDMARKNKSDFVVDTEKNAP